MQHNHTSEEGASLLPCPICDARTDSLKRYTLVQLLVFLLLFAWVRKATYTACPGCMRKIVLRNLFSINILTANLLWVLVFVPVDLVVLLSCGSKGHSKIIQKELAARSPVSTTAPQTAPAPSPARGGPPPQTESSLVDP